MPMRWYTDEVPTTRPRHQVTETDELAAALDEAAVRWPDLSRGRLITRLAVEENSEPLPLGSVSTETKLKMSDCCVLFSARDQKARLASFDERVVKAAQALGVHVVEA